MRNLYASHIMFDKQWGVYLLLFLDVSFQSIWREKILCFDRKENELINTFEVYAHRPQAETLSFSSLYSLISIYHLLDLLLSKLLNQLI